MEFQERFSSERACLEYLAACRWPDGFVCPGCGGRRAWVLERRHLWECAVCHAQTSVTAGTVMHRTRTPLRLWFWAAYLVATHHPGISAKQLQRQLGLSRYETAWLILQKLRRAMVAPERELLKDEVEVDEFYLGGEESGLKGGRQRGKKALVGVVIEVRRGLRPGSPARPRGRLAGIAQRSGPVDHHAWCDRPHRRLARLLGAEKAGIRPSAAQEAAGRSRRGAVAPSAPFRVKPQSLAARHPPRRRRPPPPGLSRRIRLPPQPAPDADGGLPNTPWPRCTASAQHLPADHSPRTDSSLSQPDTH